MTLDPAATVEALGLCWLVVRADDDCFLVNRLDATAYVVIGATAEEERQLAAAGFALDRAEAAADNAA